jgi:hypothetical protein
MQLSISGLLCFFGSLLDRLFATVLSAVPRTQKIPRDKLQERLKRDIDSRDPKKKVSKTDLLSSVLFATPFRSDFSLNESHTARNLAVPSNRENALESNP